ncbi:hypothetical protein Sango_2333900 [Sesamum angolense]|uniref:Mitochondrial transcription termination factor family protein n=1 Tax=Sesamum angolense TaxID=2727404 RepID=A0AAE2BJ26_9LAMI|nr:hypothetical protein Sango_2333900 [Sesamum angolense]
MFAGEKTRTSDCGGSGKKFIQRPCVERESDTSDGLLWGAKHWNKIPVFSSPHGRSRTAEVLTTSSIQLPKTALSAYGFSNEEEDKILGKAFGQIHSPYWGEERKKEVPKFEVVSEILNYLKDLGLTDDDLGKLLKKFPEVLGCSLEHELKANVQILEKEWGIRGKTLRSLLLRNPRALGYNIDCKGDCMAQCTRCWARF